MIQDAPFELFPVHSELLTKPPCVVDCGPTLEGAGCLLGQSEVLLCQMVDRLVLVDLHTGAYVALTMQEEGEGAG